MAAPDRAARVAPLGSGGISRGDAADFIQIEADLKALFSHAWPSPGAETFRAGRPCREPRRVRTNWSWKPR